MKYTILVIIANRINTKEDKLKDTLGILRGWNANLLRVLLHAALEHVAILNPCAKSST
jgi:hypothetical protein